MNFDSFEAFIHMGGHGLFVWSAYGITLVVLAFNFLQPILLKRKFLSNQKRVIERESAREAA
ncbi:MAG: heme exporter protein CcmD [Pseudomonadales bacterium]|nr:heme exporter protein CcmD [Pseudomonadales bacterium]